MGDAQVGLGWTRQGFSSVEVRGDADVLPVGQVNYGDGSIDVHGMGGFGAHSRDATRWSKKKPPPVAAPERAKFRLR